MTVDTVSAGTCAVMGQPRPVSHPGGDLQTLLPVGTAWRPMGRGGVARFWRIAKRRPGCYLH
jgi:hypothetical protein